MGYFDDMFDEDPEAEADGLRPYASPWATRPTIPKSYVLGQIAGDQYLSSLDKATALGLVRDAGGSKPTGLISWRDIGRAAVGAGVGAVAGNMLGKGLGLLYSGGLTAGTTRKLQAAGALAGILRATGVIGGR